MNSNDIKIKGMRHLIKDAADIFGVTGRLIRSESRVQDAVEARAMIYLYLKKQGYSMTLIAKAFSKNYDTVGHAIRQWKYYTISNPTLTTRYKLFADRQDARL
jgi:chromosomal replication initiation ATPase DnaA